MKVGIDLTIANVNQAGTGIYAGNLVSALNRLDDGNIYHTFALNQHHDIGRPKTMRSRLETLYRDIVWMHAQLPWQARQAKIDVLHTPANVMPYYTDRPTTLTILDTTVFRMPESFRRWQRTYYRLFVPISAKRASTILTISEQSKRDIVAQFSVPSDKVRVTYLAASERFGLVSKREIADIKEKYNLGSFILTTGTLEPRKNIARLVQAFERMRSAYSCLELIHVGPKGWLYDSILAEVRRLGIEGSVRFLGRVPLEDLARLYNAADAFVYPSLYEGFGLPPLEAMACGCPVITSNVSALPEVVGDAAILVDPYDLEQIAEALRQILDQPELARSMRDRGIRRAAQFSWERCARETAAAYQVARGM
jgi:glycosyltransferase involved in cell wall biosynthesis